MAKKGGNNRSRGVAAKSDFKKRKIRRKQKQTGAQGNEKESLIFGVISRRKFTTLTDIIVKYSAWAPYTLCCLQFGIDPKSNNGSKRHFRVSLKRRLFHYVIITLLFVSMVHKFCVSVAKIREQERPDVETWMCFSLFMIQFVGFAMGLSLVFRWQESMEIMNTWDDLVAYADETGETTPYDDIPCSLRLWLCLAIAISCGTANGIVSLLFSNLPVCFYPMFQEAGFIPDIGLPPFAWQLAFFPLELILGTLAMMNGNLGGIVLHEAVGVQRVCATVIKEMNPLNLEARQEMEKLYVYLQIYHRAYCVWWNLALPGTIVSLSATIVLSLYVSIRYTDIPWYLYWVFPMAGFAVLFQEFGFAVDVMGAKEDSQEIIDKLQSPASASLQRLSFEERKKILRRSKALTQLPFPIASFTDYSWSVPLAAWDEILNQLFFLLSL